MLHHIHTMLWVHHDKKIHQVQKLLLVHASKQILCAKTYKVQWGKQTNEYWSGREVSHSRAIEQIMHNRERNTLNIKSRQIP